VQAILNYEISTRDITVTTRKQLLLARKRYSAFLILHSQCNSTHGQHAASSSYWRLNTETAQQWVHQRHFWGSHCDNSDNIRTSNDDLRYPEYFHAYSSEGRHEYEQTFSCNEKINTQCPLIVLSMFRRMEQQKISVITVTATCLTIHSAHNVGHLQEFVSTSFVN